MAEKLKRCPSCDSENIEIYHKGNEYSRKRSVTIKCKHCALMRTTGSTLHDIKWCEEKAIKAWNTRVPFDPWDWTEETFENCVAKLNVNYYGWSITTGSRENIVIAPSVNMSRNGETRIYKNGYWVKE